MAINWFVGVDSQDAGCVKIMASDAFDPVTTPDSDFGKFLYNSKLSANLRFVGTDQLNFQDGEFEQFLPSGTNKNNFLKARYGFDTGAASLYWKSSFWTGLDYDLPVFDLKVLNGAGVYVYGQMGSREANSATRFESYSALEDGYVNGMLPGAGSKINVTLPPTLCSFAVSDRHKKAVIWNLPGDETDILSPALAPVPGQTQVQITKDFCRASKPGYAVETATASQLAFDSASRPVKIIAAGDIALPSGTTVFDFSDKLAGITVSGELVADVIQYKGSTIVFPASLPNDDDQYGATFRFIGKTLVFSNSGSSCRARILIIAQDTSSQTVGDNDVWREFNDGTQDVVQFLRPGAGDPPRLADVIIDSRWPALQIIKTGVFNIPTGSAEQTDITFDSGGLFPFIKYFTIHGSGQPNSTLGGSSDKSASGKRIRLPIVAAGFARNPDNGDRFNFIGGDTTMCQLTTNRARFITYRGNVWRLKYTQNSNNQFVLGSDGVSCPATKIRYYIFGIPA